LGNRTQGLGPTTQHYIINLAFLNNCTCAVFGRNPYTFRVFDFKLEMTWRAG